jgi:hypothetical protein
VCRRVKFRLLVLVLLQWQAGLGLMLPISTLHASEAVEIAADAGPSPCHGEGVAAEHHESPPAEVPPCCQSHGCQGDCVVMPAMPTVIAAIGVAVHTEESNAVLRAGMVPPPMVEFFRPPI